MPFGQHRVLVLTKRHVGSGNEIAPSLKDVAWLERAQLIFQIFHAFVNLAGWKGRGGKQITDKTFEN